MITCIDDMGIVHGREDHRYALKSHLHVIHHGNDGWRDTSYGFRKSMHMYSIYFVSQKVIR